MKNAFLLFLVLGVGLFSWIAFRGRRGSRMLAAVPNKVSWADGKFLKAKRKLPVHLEVKETCAFGDADALQMDLDLSPKSPLLLSLESLEGKENEATSAPIERADWNTGSVDVTLDLVSKATSESYVLSLCRDNARAGTCFKKETLSPTDLVVQNTKKMADEKHFAPADRTYWFSPLILYPDRVRFAQLTPAFTKAEEWKKFLLTNPEIKKKATAHLEALAAHLAAQRPLSARWSAGTLEVTLTIRNASLCAQKKD